MAPVGISGAAGDTLQQVTSRPYNQMKIEQKIIGFSVVKESAGDKPYDTMHEQVVRPPVLLGATYKIKTPLSEHALYVTINDVLLNEGTPHETRRPFEVFINSKAMEHFQWIVALTRIISAVFRKGGDCTFLVEEMRSVFDPKGGYFKKGGKYMPSLVAEIGDALETHMRSIGLLKDNPDTLKLIEAAKLNVKPGDPEKAVFCNKCQTKAAVVMDGCLTCLNCGDSKCG